MPARLPAVGAACQRVDSATRSDRRYAHTSAFRVVVDDALVHESHYGGPLVAEVFSVTKTVLATLTGIALRLGPLRDIDEPGRTFRYDNGAGHLLSAALTGVLAGGVDRFAQRTLFEPLAIDGASWLRDPDGIATGSGFLRLRAVDLSRLGQLWLDGGRRRGRQLVDPDFATAMVSRQSDGGPPEGCAYGFGTWVADDHFFAGGWAGQHVLVVPAARAAVVVTGSPRFRLGPPPTDELPADWRPAKDLVVTSLLPVLRAA